MTNSADQISWLLKKPTDLDLHCLQRQGTSGFRGPGLIVGSKFHWNAMNYNYFGQCSSITVLVNLFLQGFFSHILHHIFAAWRNKKNINTASF